MINVAFHDFADPDRTYRGVHELYVLHEVGCSGFLSRAASVPRFRDVVVLQPRLPAAEQSFARSSHDMRNLLQVVASAFHLLDRQIGDDLRPLIDIGLAALRQVGDQRRSLGNSDAR